MAICNRDLDASQQMNVLHFKEGAVATGATVLAATVPYPSTLQKWQFTAVGASGAPVYNLVVQRWTSAGITSIVPGPAVTLAANFGVSGGMIGSTFNAGSTLSQLQTGDLVLLVSTGANTAVTQLIGDIVIQSTQDIKATYLVP